MAGMAIRELAASVHLAMLFTRVCERGRFVGNIERFFHSTSTLSFAT